MSKKNKKIVCIDDEMPGLISLVMICESEKYDVEDFTSPREGLEYIEKNPDKVGLVFLDLMMPEIYGMNVLKKLKSNPKTKGIPVIMNSCLTDPEEIKKSHDLGAAEFISKPFSKAIIIDNIKKYFHG
ncbi:MAG: response regulator [Rickettsiales bacterium]